MILCPGIYAMTQKVLCSDFLRFGFIISYLPINICQICICIADSLCYKAETNTPL